MSKKEKKVKKNNPSERAVKARAFFKRYWYWFVAIAVLIGATFGWCAAMGLFEPDYSDEIPENVSIFSFTYYKLPDKIGKYDAEYAVPDKYSDIISVSGNVLYAKKAQVASLQISYGKTVTAVRVEANYYSSTWKVGVGDEFSETQIYGLANSLQPYATRFDNTDTTVLAETTASDGSKKYVVAKEGFAILKFSRDDELVCVITLIAKNNLAENEKSVETTQSLVSDANFRTEPNVKTTKNLSAGAGGEKIGATEIATLFGAGNIYFESSNPSVAKVYQDGTVEIGVPGKATVTVACVGDYVASYFSINYVVAVGNAVVTLYDETLDADRNFRVGESLTLENLHKFFYSRDVSYYAVNKNSEAYITQEKVDGETRFRALKSTGAESAYVTGYSADGKEIVVYEIGIDAKTEGTK